MPKYMDVHSGFTGVTQEQLREAHERDLAVEASEGVHFERAWLDPDHDPGRTSAKPWWRRRRLRGAVPDRGETDVQRRGLRLLVSGAVLAMAAVAAPVGSADAAPVFYRTMVGRGSGKCADVRTQDNITVQLWGCSGVTEQDWRFEFALATGGTDYYRIFNRRTQRCLGIAGDSTRAGVAAQIQFCAGDDSRPTQLWSFQTVYLGNDPWTVIRNRWSGLCLDARGNATGNGTIIQQYTCNGTTAQLWYTNNGVIV